MLWLGISALQNPLTHISQVVKTRICVPIRDDASEEIKKGKKK